MSRSSIDHWEPTSPSIAARTFVLVGRTGNGKSATGNTILGRRAFNSKASSSGVSVTSTCELQQTTLEDGQIINVIDTPGLFDSRVGSEFIGKEIVKCMDLAKDGIHAFLVILSVRSRFSEEEADALRSLETLFGSRVFDYMIVVFTGGDELEDNEETLEDYLGRESPEPLKEILALCKNRRVVFDNKTKHKPKKIEQLQQLLSLVNMVMSETGGQPYTNDMFAELKKGARKVHDQLGEVNSSQRYSKRGILELKEQINASYDEQIKRTAAMVEAKLNDTKGKLEQQLAAEQAERLKAQQIAQLAQEKSNDEIRKLRKNLEEAQEENKELLRKNLKKAQKDNKELRKEIDKKDICHIL